MLALQMAGIPLARTQGELSWAQEFYLTAALAEYNRRQAEAMSPGRRR
jgi:hypothetical protein